MPGALELYLAGRLLQLMNSSLNVTDSNNGITLDFSLLMKVTDWDEIGDIRNFNKTAPGQKATQSLSFRTNDSRILLVDDNDTITSVIRNLFSDSRITFDEAGSVEEALRLIRLNEYDLIFTEVFFDNSEKDNLLRIIRKGNINILNAHKPIIALTSEGDVKEYESDEYEGFDEVLLNPPDPSLIEKYLLRYLPESKVEITDASGLYPDIFTLSDIRKYSGGYEKLYRNAGDIYKRAGNFRSKYIISKD